MDQLNINFSDIKFNLNFKDPQIGKVNSEKTETEQIEQTNKKETKISNKCSICKKKLLLAMNFGCGCDETKRFCGTHRFPEEHSCTKKVEKVVLEKVVADKIDRI